ncbi:MULTISPECIES: Mu transposase C-terminal domain-containing protein [Antrihabitans]|uniref:Mu transposase C-terminal domain-containing protein n=2 Tax=Antrihabitans TaxID=2799491 RepID=A0A934U3E1_9NOCA|nr:Mu transposase C-terminal domain-containing protein [Antrihabitans stalagmiti]MBJ8339526.1 Mu transposase C-terminal domain-containing protein [Antrihabitans stalagmiti]
MAESGTPPIVTHETSFLIDFLPVIRRTLTRSGFQVDHVQYHSDALKTLQRYEQERDWLHRQGVPMSLLPCARDMGRHDLCSVTR